MSLSGRDIVLDLSSVMMRRGGHMLDSGRLRQVLESADIAAAVVAQRQLLERQPLPM